MSMWKIHQILDRPQHTWQRHTNDVVSTSSWICSPMWRFCNCNKSTRGSASHDVARVSRTVVPIFNLMFFILWLCCTDTHYVFDRCAWCLIASVKVQVVPYDEIWFECPLPFSLILLLIPSRTLSRQFSLVQVWSRKCNIGYTPNGSDPRCCYIYCFEIGLSRMAWKHTAISCAPLLFHIWSSGSRLVHDSLRSPHETLHCS